MLFVFRTVPLLMCCLLIQETKVTNSHGLEMNGILPVSLNKVFFFFSWGLVLKTGKASHCGRRSISFSGSLDVMVVSHLLFLRSTNSALKGKKASCN